MVVISVGALQPEERPTGSGQPLQGVACIDGFPVSLQTNGNSNGLVPMLRVYNNTARYVDQGGNKVPHTSSRREPRGMESFHTGQGCPTNTRELMEWLWVTHHHKGHFPPVLVSGAAPQFLAGLGSCGRSGAGQQVSFQGQFVLIWIVFRVPETWGFCHLPGAVALGHL